MQLALLEVAISTCLRAGDLLSLTWAQVLREDGTVNERLPVKQQKTHKVVEVRLGDRARNALMAWSAGRTTERVFPFTRQHYGNLVKVWARMAHLNAEFFSTHSLRRTHPAHVHKRTGNAAACAHMLGHTNLGHTIRYLGVDVTSAHKVATENEI
jgi:integrase